VPNALVFAYLYRPVMAKGCTGEGWHGASQCSRDSSRVNTPQQITHSRRRIGFFGRSTLGELLSNSLPILS